MRRIEENEQKVHTKKRINLTVPLLVESLGNSLVIFTKLRGNMPFLSSPILPVNHSSPTHSVMTIFSPAAKVRSPRLSDS